MSYIAFRALGLAVVVGSLMEAAWLYGRLPDPMASTFGGDGTPVAFASKPLVIGIMVGATMFWAAMLFVLPVLTMNRFGGVTSADGRWLRDRLGQFGFMSLLFSAATSHLVLEANINAEPLSALFVWALVLYLPYVTWWTILLILKARQAKP